ncbi:unnamed protein product [Rotaria sordida]|uniref:ABC transporter domain-containing protein n=1 Tax=Rotaria sordida TaxID=392033 RepID=A0A815ZE03_9BILA|nr:unnamed protein product [Rotaria sordida]CAF1582046.1 unnamed protein product [Rotaria sordida]
MNDSGLLRFSFLNFYKSNFDENTLDDDVLAERHRILNLNHLQKTENTMLAVNHFIFGAKRDEAFGLLGYNGAGKTTTFRIIVGDEIATHGTGYIDG